VSWTKDTILLAVGFALGFGAHVVTQQRQADKLAYRHQPLPKRRWGVNDNRVREVVRQMRSLARDWRRSAAVEEEPTVHARRLGRADGLVQAARLLEDDDESQGEGGT